jgi:hypothetical protein
MSTAISDRAVLTVLLPFVRATRPVLAALRDCDPFGLRSRVFEDRNGNNAGELDRSAKDQLLDKLATVHLPGTAAWAAMTPAQRDRWWVYRVGRFTTLLASVPGLGGALADRLPLQSALGAAGQGLLLCAVAGEHGVTDEDQVVALLGAVLFQRDLRVGRDVRAADEGEIDARAEELTGELDKPGATPTLLKIGTAVWRLGRALVALEGELDKRPHGRWYHRLLGLIPVLGMLGDYLGEWSGLKRAAGKGTEWLRLNT